MALNPKQTTNPNFPRTVVCPVRDNGDKENRPVCTTEHTKLQARTKTRGETIDPLNQPQQLIHTSNHSSIMRDINQNISTSFNSRPRDRGPTASKSTSTLGSSNSRVANTPATLSISTTSSKDSSGINKLEVYRDATTFPLSHPLQSTRSKANAVSQPHQPTRNAAFVRKIPTSLLPRGTATSNSANPPSQNVPCRNVTNPLQIERQRTIAAAARKGDTTFTASHGDHQVHTQEQREYCQRALKEIWVETEDSWSVEFEDFNNQNYRKRTQQDSDESSKATRRNPGTASVSEPSPYLGKRQRVGNPRRRSTLERTAAQSHPRIHTQEQTPRLERAPREVCVLEEDFWYVEIEDFKNQSGRKRIRQESNKSSDATRGASGTSSVRETTPNPEKRQRVEKPWPRYTERVEAALAQINAVTAAQGQPRVHTQQTQHRQRVAAKVMIEIEDSYSQDDRCQARQDPDRSRDATRASSSTASISQRQPHANRERRQRVEVPRCKPIQPVDTVAARITTVTAAQGHRQVDIQEQAECALTEVWVEMEGGWRVKYEDVNSQNNRKRARHDSDESGDVTRAAPGKASISQPQPLSNPEKRQRVDTPQPKTRDSWSVEPRDFNDQDNRNQTRQHTGKSRNATRASPVTVASSQPQPNAEQRRRAVKPVPKHTQQVETAAALANKGLVEIKDFNNRNDQRQRRSDESGNATKAAPGTASTSQPRPSPEQPQVVEEPQHRLTQQAETAPDLTLPPECSDKIFEHLHKMEIDLAPSIRYLKRRSDDFWDLRHFLVNKIALVHDQIGACPETLFLAINIFDRVFSKESVSFRRSHHNGVVALTCLWIASKCEEECNPYVNVRMFERLLSVFDDSDPVGNIDSRAFRDCEQEILSMLGYELGWPGPIPFLTRYSWADERDPRARSIAEYILEIILLLPSFVVYKPSVQAAAAMHLGRCIMSRCDWSETMIEHSGYTFEQLKPVVMDMVAFLKEPVVPHTVAYRKHFGRSTLLVSEYVHCLEDDLPPSILRRRTNANTHATTDATTDTATEVNQGHHHLRHCCCMI